MNVIFLEEFKGLDKLCREKLNIEQRGVTHYIEEMKAVSEYNYRNISGWKADLQYLKYVRGIRNNLVHEEGTLYKKNCTQKDIDWIRNFHDRILKQSDPIAMLYQRNKVNEQTGAEIYKQISDETSKQVNVQEYEESDKFNTFGAILLLIIIFLAIILIVLGVEIMFR